MEFNESELIAAAVIGFDMIEGPFLKWAKRYANGEIDIDFEGFMMKFYLSFRGGNDGLKPLAIIYDKFYIVAFPNGLELVCLFMRTGDTVYKIHSLNNLAQKIINETNKEEEAEEKEMGQSGENEDYNEIKRIIVNMLRDQQLSTPDIRKYFRMSNSEIWKIMSQLEEEQQIVRTQKIGRTQFWTAAL
ncbi:MAG: hypothetical protein ACTSU2_04235 [Promethearchaeota archaeon]